jgi:hypothetical protein
MYYCFEERKENLMQRILVLVTLVILLTSCVPTSTPTAVVSCDVTAPNGATVYERPSAASDEFGMLTSSDTIHPTAKTADGFYGFTPNIAQAGNVGLFRLRWVLKTVDLTATAGCANLPTVVAPIAGICYAMMMGDTPIYSSPDTTSAQVTTMHLNDYAMVTARNTGWLTLDLNVASPSMNKLGYLEESQLGGLNGPCSGL